MKFYLIALGVAAVLLVVILVAAGYELPVKHRAIIHAAIGAPPERVYALITDVAGEIYNRSSGSSAGYSSATTQRCGSMCRTFSGL